MRVEAWRNGTRNTFGQVLQAYAAPAKGEDKIDIVEANKLLAQAGLRIVLAEYEGRCPFCGGRGGLLALGWCHRPELHAVTYPPAHQVAGGVRPIDQTAPAPGKVRMPTAVAQGAPVEHQAVDREDDGRSNDGGGKKCIEHDAPGLNLAGRYKT